MIIGITINEVLRDFIGQFAYTYDKYIEPFDLKETPVDNWNLVDFFEFKTVKEMNKFLYTGASLEIFGHADQLHTNVITKLNKFASDLLDEEEHEVVLISREVDKAIPSTLFFLSKLGFNGSNIRFLNDTSKKWDYCDILITANPIALDAKPEGKISVKVNASYNAETKADHEIDSVVDLFESEELLSKILEE